MGVQASANSARFLDTENAYSIFSGTTDEKKKTGEILRGAATAPGFRGERFLDAGLGNGHVLNVLLSGVFEESAKGANLQSPKLVVAKEYSAANVFAGVGQLLHHFVEYPAWALTVTNLPFKRAPRLDLQSDSKKKIQWIDIQLSGDSLEAFSAQIERVRSQIETAWAVDRAKRHMPPLHQAVLTISRRDQQSALDGILPVQGASRSLEYDFISAAYPWRLATPAQGKVETVVQPLAESLAPGGKLFCFQAMRENSQNPNGGAALVERMWPGKNFFPVGLDEIAQETRAALGPERAAAYGFAERSFGYQMARGQLADDAFVEQAVGNAVYVAQVPQGDVAAADQEAALAHARDILKERGGRLDFTSGILEITRQPA